MSVLTDKPSADLAERLALIEDRLAIYNLIASHPISADSGIEHVMRGIYTDDASFYRGEELHGAMGIDKIVAFVQSAPHQQAIGGGLAHFGSLPLVELHGDTAYATSYIMIITPDTEAEAREVPNHGDSTGFRIHRVVANRWTMVRVDGRWKIKARAVTPLDGTEPAQKILAKAGTIYETAGGATA